MYFEQPQPIYTKERLDRIELVDRSQILIASKPVVPSIRRRTPEEEFKLSARRVTEINFKSHPGFPFTYMQLRAPEWWHYGSGIAYPYGYNFDLQLKNDPTTTLEFSSPGAECTEDNPMRNLFKDRPRMLNPEEMKTLGSAIEEAHTEMLNGKLVVVETGFFKDEGKKFYRLEFNHNPEGPGPLVTGEITFMAKPDKYKKYLPAVQAALKTIRWSDKVTIEPH